jgi:large subunit ribosomal protein L15
MVEKKKPAAKSGATRRAAKKNVAASVKKAAVKERAAARKAERKTPAPKAKGVAASAGPSSFAEAPEDKTAHAAPADHRPRATGIHDLGPAAGATHSIKRVGRGPGSGQGKTAGRGSKGQKSRSGYRHQRGFEGGQMPLHRRLPKRGFTNVFRIEYDIVNLSDLDRFEAGQKVTPAELVATRLARKSRPVKILGDGSIGKALNISAHKFSASAQAKIEAAGGRCEVIPR